MREIIECKGVWVGGGVIFLFSFCKIWKVSHLCGQFTQAVFFFKRVLCLVPFFKNFLYTCFNNIAEFCTEYEGGKKKNSGGFSD